MLLTRLNHSLSAKLLLLFICAGAVLLLLAGSILGKGFSRHFRHSISPFIAHYSELMQQELGQPPNREKALQITRDLPLDIHVFGPSGNWSTAAQLLDRRQLVRPRARPRHGHNRRGIMRLSQEYSVKRFEDQLVLQTQRGEYEVYFQIYDHRGIGRGGRPYGIILIVCILGILLLIYYATRALFRPIQDIQQGVQTIGSGNLGHRIAKRRDDELGDLTDSVNAMADDISTMLEAKRQLLLAINHELRSPLTRSCVNLELLDDSKPKREIKQDLDAMQELVNELLESAKLNSRHALQTEWVSIDALIRELLHNEFAGCDIHAELDAVRAIADPFRLKMLLRNLLQNAVKYAGKSVNRPQVNLSLQAHDSDFIVSVQDYGGGIDREHIPHLTEPFYRADPSRQRKTGGYGLGLYLCRMIVEAHRGKLEISSRLGHGTTIICRIPLQLVAHAN